MRRVSCRWVRQRKWRYLDGTLPAPQKRLVEAHLQACIPCRAEFVQAQDALQALTAGKPLTPEQQRALRRPQSGLTPIRVAGAAIFALLLGVGGYLWRTQGDTLLERLAARGATPAAVAESEMAESPSAPIEAPSAAQAEPPPSENVPVVSVETSPIEPPPAAPKSAEVAPKPAETPPRAAAPAPPRRPSSAQTRPAPPRRANTPPKQSTAPAPPPEGTVEVYDAAGNLIQRRQLQEKR